MSKQDRQGVRTPADLERKYDLAAIAGLKVASKNNTEDINKTNATLENFIVSTLGSIENLQSQIDGNITTWFYSGVPDLNTLPASEWTTEELKSNHLGDLYYDQETGRAYRFVVNDGVYSWIKLADNDVAEALALANAAQDTADSKRRVFVDTPTPPYDNGDLWFCDKEIYICQISKTKEESYTDGDFILATKYTDDTLAKKVGDDLEIVRGTVTTIRENADSFQIEIEKKISSINERQQETIEELKKTSYSFGTEELAIEKSGSEMKTTINEDGMRIYKNAEKVLEANNTGVDARNLHATTYLIIGRNSRFEDYGSDRTACFWIGGNS